MSSNDTRRRAAWLATAATLATSATLGAVLAGGPASAAGNDIDPLRGDLDTTDHATEWGPLSQYDRNLLINVAWANLWEGPTSARIAERSMNAQVRAVAAQLGREHHELDAAVTQTAAQLGVTLPTQPNPLQRAWERDILGRSGADADTVWANLTRQAHGSIFPLVAQVRAHTRNDVMRAFAQRADEIVLRHMTLLESTALVRSDSLYVPATAAAQFQPVPSRREWVEGAAVGLLVLLASVAAVRVLTRYERRAAAQ
ncbi:DUF4142 domain-containing protein [Krasilnikovia sp. MM14-A1004]|uniref:DUF4142 domain-containing protein n=1 Tax=Krasilnikovia sp. MM14-A1004 TaxID=3373541 RepID=UPI00399D3AF5